MIGLAQCDSLSAPVQTVHTTLELVNLAVMIVWIVDPHTGTVDIASILISKKTDFKSDR